MSNTTKPRFKDSSKTSKVLKTYRETWSNNSACTLMESKIKYLNLGVLAFQTMDLAHQNMDQSKNIEKNIFDNF